MSHYYNRHTNTCHIIPIFRRHVTLLKFLLLQFSQFTNCHKNKCLLSQMSHDHISNYFNFLTTTCHIIPNFTPQHKLFKISEQIVKKFSKFSQDLISNYSDFHTTTCHIAPIFTRPHVTLFQFSETTCQIIPIFRRNTYQFIPIFTRISVTFFDLPHDLT